MAENLDEAIQRAYVNTLAPMAPVNPQAFGALRQLGSGVTSDREFQAYQQAISDPAMRQAGSGVTSDREFQAYQQMMADPAMRAMSGERSGPPAVELSEQDRMLGSPEGGMGQTRGLPPEVSGINPEMANQEAMMEYVRRKAEEIRGRMGGQPDYGGSFENFLRSIAPRIQEQQPKEGGQ